MDKVTIEEQLAEAAKKGLVSLTLHAEWSNDCSKTYWTCRATPSARHGYVGVEHSLDPVEAVRECLRALPGAKLIESGKKKRDVTAKVIGGTAEPPDQSTERIGNFDQWMKP
jgi:hypothetical protein